MHNCTALPNVLLLLALRVILIFDDNRILFVLLLIVFNRIDHASDFSIIFIDFVVMIDHVSKLTVIFANSFVCPYFFVPYIHDL